MKLKKEKYRHIFAKENYIRINNTYNLEIDKATDIKNIYNIVKQQYANRFNNDELNIKLEKIYLNKKLEDYMGGTLNYWMKFIFIVVTVFVTNSFNQAFTQKNISSLTVLAMFIILTAITIFIFKKNIKKEINEHTYYKICLTVLDELEKENK
jgi:cbb3-type cytochrome oxidase subunit 3